MFIINNDNNKVNVLIKNSNTEWILIILSCLGVNSILRA